MQKYEWDVVIIGGGSAGLSAAFMLGRARRRVQIVDGAQPRNRFAAHMHGVIGRDGYSPLEFLAEGRAELEAYGVVVRTGLATAVEPITGEETGTGFTVTTDDGTTVTTRRVLVATGIRDELPAIDGLTEQWGRGVVVCPYCDGWESRDRSIGVIATGEMGVHQAQMLRQWTPDVTYFTQGTFPPSDDDRRGLVARGIRIDERPIARVVSDGDDLRAVELSDGESVTVDRIFTGPRFVPLDGVLVALGAETTEMMGTNWTTTDAMGQTSIPGIWAAGNLASPAGGSVTVAMGLGTTAGASINANLMAEDIAIAVAAGGTHE